MLDELGGDDRVYLLDDGITGDIIDSAPGGQDGTWNAIGSGNVVSQKGAFIPMTNY